MTSLVWSHDCPCPRQEAGLQISRGPFLCEFSYVPMSACDLAYEKATTDIAMTTNWVSAGVAASCKEKSARFLERNAHQSPKLYSTRFLGSMLPI